MSDPMVSVDLQEIVFDFTLALKGVDSAAPVGESPTRQYQAGVGPLRESVAVKAVLAILRAAKPAIYACANPRRYPNSRQCCDCVVPGRWAIEFKLVRPFGDNGVEAEHWSENLLHPYAGNVSAIADCLKLRDSGFHERKAIVVFGYEHTPPKIDLETAVHSFEVVAKQVIGIPLGPRVMGEAVGLMHPYHQQAKVFGWEIMKP